MCTRVHRGHYNVVKTKLRWVKLRQRRRRALFPKLLTGPPTLLIQNSRDKSVHCRHRQPSWLIDLERPRSLSNIARTGGHRLLNKLVFCATDD